MRKIRNVLKIDFNTEIVPVNSDADHIPFVRYKDTPDIVSDGDVIKDEMIRGAYEIIPWSKTYPIPGDEKNKPTKDQLPPMAEHTERKVEFSALGRKWFVTDTQYYAVNVNDRGLITDLEKYNDEVLRTIEKTFRQIGYHEAMVESFLFWSTMKFWERLKFLITGRSFVREIKTERGGWQ